MLHADMFAMTSALQKFLVGLSLCGLLGIAGCSGSKAPAAKDKAAETEDSKSKESVKTGETPKVEADGDSLPGAPPPPERQFKARSMSVGAASEVEGRGMTETALEEDERAGETEQDDDSDGSQTGVMMDE